MPEIRKLRGYIAPGAPLNFEICDGKEEGLRLVAGLPPSGSTNGRESVLGNGFMRTPISALRRRRGCVRICVRPSLRSHTSGSMVRWRNVLPFQEFMPPVRWQWYIGCIRVGKYQMRKGGESDPRNKTLMKMFNLIDIGERAGSGVPEMFSVWEDQGWEEPVIEERFGEAERTVLVLSFKKKVREKTQEKRIK